MIITTDAIILHSRKFSDSSKILVAFTRDEGKVSLIAKGARNPKSKYGSSLEPLSYSSLTIYKKPQRELHTLGKAEIITPMRRLASDYEKLKAALTVVEAVNLTQVNDMPHVELFTTLHATLQELNNSEGNEFAFSLWFQFQLAKLMGFMVEAETFLDTGSPIIAEPSHHYIMSIANGGILSAETSQYASGYRLTAQELDIVNMLCSYNLSLVHTIHIQETVKARLVDFMTQYFSFHLDKRLNYRSQRLLIDMPISLPSAEA